MRRVRRIRDTGTALLQWWREDVGNVIAPARCLDCLRAGGWFCTGCLQERLLVPPHLECVACEHRSSTGRTCPRCAADTPLSGLVWAGRYREAWVQRGVGWLKFRGLSQLAEPLAWLVAARLPSIAPLRYLREQAVLVPVPLHARRLRARGYNQSSELAQALSRLTQIPVVEALVRTVATVPQSHLAARWRALNVMESFQLTTPLPAERRVILIIDDVVTTGATLTAAATAVVAAAAPELPPRAMWGVAVAKG